MARSPRPTITRPTPAPSLGRRRFLTGAGLTLAGLTVYSAEIARLLRGLAKILANRLFANRPSGPANLHA